MATVGLKFLTVCELERVKSVLEGFEALNCNHVEWLKIMQCYMLHTETGHVVTRSSNRVSLIYLSAYISVPAACATHWLDLPGVLSTF